MSRSIRNNKKGVNVLITNVLMTGAVLALGFAVLLWSQERTLQENSDYLELTDVNIGRIKEKISYEYIRYDVNNKLFIYIMNTGQNIDITVERVYLANDTYSAIFSDIELKFFNGNPTDDLYSGEEGYFELDVDLIGDIQYSIRIVTERGRYFDQTFIA